MNRRIGKVTILKMAHVGCDMYSIKYMSRNKHGLGCTFRGQHRQPFGERWETFLSLTEFWMPSFLPLGNYTEDKRKV
jgi:hypothetical protein